MGNVIISERIEFLSRIKKEQLKLKKSERTSSLQDLDDRISRLKRWQKQLDHQAQQKKVREAAKVTQQAFNQLGKAMQSAIRPTRVLGKQIQMIGYDNPELLDNPQNNRQSAI